MQLSVDSIVVAAMDILDRYGLADMTMRRVASNLEVAPGALYWHIKNKQELISAIAERILDSADPADFDGVLAVDADHPAATVARSCAALRRVLMSHRDGAELVMAAMTQPASTLRPRIVDDFTEELRRIGLDGATAHAGAQALLHQVFGATTFEQAARQNRELLSGDGASTSGAETSDAGVRLLLDALTWRD